jgi:hypothetical protein
MPIVAVVAVDQDMQTPTTTSIHKVRRDALGGKRGDGHKRLGHRIVRPDPRRIRVAEGDASLTGCGGLASFGAFLRQQGIDRELGRRFSRLKAGPLVVYPMPAQMRLLIDAATVGADRVFGLESWAADPLFVRLAGGVIPSLDTGSPRSSTAFPAPHRGATSTPSARRRSKAASPRRARRSARHCRCSALAA